MGKKRICLISLGNLYLCPYISKYTSLLNCDYDVIYWNRHGIQETVCGAKQTFSFDYNMEEGTSKFNKLLGYIKFRKYILGILKKNNYEGIILLQTMAGVLLQSILKTKYAGRYIVDIRDYTMENNPLFFAIEKVIIENSAYTVISSKGYEKFLPKYNYILVHNDATIDRNVIEKFESRKKNTDRIVISCIGLIRFHEQNKKVILKFKNDSRFILRFIGKDSLALKEFCEKNNILNVELIDRFPPEKTLDFYYETHIIYNLYGNNTPLLDYALSNKLYYAAKLRIPILVCPGTYMEQVSIKAGFGIVFDINKDNALDELYNTYNLINWDQFNIKCNLFLTKIEEDNNNFEDIIKKFEDNLIQV